jgi:prolyl-tRNA synthetase
MDSSAVVAARRDNGAKETIAWADLAARVPALLEEVQADLLAGARARYDASVETAATWDEFMAALDRKCAFGGGGGFFFALWLCLCDERVCALGVSTL